jgi:DNA polymerase III alpha subunit
MPDIDIDFADRDEVLSKIKHISAMRLDHGIAKKHNSGVYCHSVPFNPLTGLSSIEYKSAEERGYFKIDFLNVSAYKDVKNEEHISKLLAVEPLWELIYEKDICDQLVHINGYHSLLEQLKPTSILELAIVLALIRPGKKHLLPICKEEGFEAIKNDIWVKTDEAYYFKKSHAVSYAHLIVMQLNLICEQISEASSGS